MTDQQLLAAFAARRDESAFAELVRRHLDWVRTAAARRTGDAHAADDVAQAVFIALAAKAASLPRDRPLSPWLFRATRYAAAKAVRAAGRRRHHERRAVPMTPDADRESQWEQLAPQLDDGLARLRAADRQVLLLRFFERKSLADVAAAVGTSEEAARKRVDRAVDRLRAALNPPAGTSPAGLATLLTAHAVAPAPAGFADRVKAAAVKGVASTAAAAALAGGIVHMARTAVLKPAAIAAMLAVVAIIGGSVYHRHTPQPPPATVIPPIVRAVAEDEAARALREMTASAHAMPPVHVVFKLTTAISLEGNADARPKDADGLTEAVSPYVEGDMAADGRYRFRCGSAGNPRWDGTALVDWPQS